MIEEEILNILEKRERKKFLNQIQVQSVEEGHIPPMPYLFLRKLANPLQYTGGILLGIFLGLFTLILNFVLFVLLFHLEF